MIRSMNLGVSGMINHQTRMDIIGNNISNINTTAYKSNRANFQDALYQAVGPGEREGISQVGTGVNVSKVTKNIEQGVIQPTGRNLDLAISGPCFFGVQGDSDQVKYTRDGTFSLNVSEDNNYLLNSSGMKVVDKDNEPVEISLEDGQSSKDININENGVVYVVSPGSGEDPEEAGQIGLFKFDNPEGLTKEGANLYLQNSNSGDPISPDEGSEKEFGSILSGHLEMSNVDIARQLTELVKTQRGFQANAKVFTSADEVLQKIINLKR
ncbi:MAG: flagellar hook-basal body complex protein [Clostridiales bacterium]|nr:flagellar hook-basal body complex protein [Clostridiales bacterium]MCF8021715.1 flagellar hook-basal body complex protein [Clostridiales bacterium]